MKIKESKPITYASPKLIYRKGQRRTSDYYMAEGD